MKKHQNVSNGIVWKGEIGTKTLVLTKIFCCVLDNKENGDFFEKCNILLFLQAILYYSVSLGIRNIDWFKDLFKSGNQ